MTVLSRVIDSQVVTACVLACAVTILVTLALLGARKINLAWFARINLLPYTAFILSVTALRPPDPASTGRVNLVPGATIMDLFSSEGTTSTAVLQVVANAVIFIPFGAGVACAVPRVHRWLLVSTITLAVAVGIEALQWTMGTGAADIDDVLLAFVGAQVGWAATKTFLDRSTRHRETSPGTHA